MPKKHPTVLIVEDDNGLNDAYKIILESAGYNVQTTHDGKEALDYLAEAGDPMAIFLDLKMSGMDGIEFIQALRKDNLCGKSTIVVLTNQGDSADIERAKDLAVDGYIVKATSIPSEVVDEVVKLYKKHKGV